VRSGFDEMKASPWEKEDAQHEGIPIHKTSWCRRNSSRHGKLTGITFEKVKAEYDAKAAASWSCRRAGRALPCDDVLVAVGQENAFPWIRTANVRH